MTKKKSKQPVLFITVEDYHKLQRTIDRCEKVLDDLKMLENWIYDYNLEVDEKEVELARDEYDLKIGHKDEGFIDIYKGKFADKFGAD